ncbi:hypothetical protein ACFSTH_20510 [Paenibacillus yanchengensis]|uniref:Endolytic transglycosylase MltG n=1 Tax=Paenibacillus yanchengensis TaxID=2035833 RepID=A0ABW4YM28_9BACL
MHKRSFLLGLGIGIIIGAILLQLIVVGEASTKKLRSHEEVFSSESQPTPLTLSEELEEVVIEEEQEKADTSSNSSNKQTNNATNSIAAVDSKKEHIIRITPGETISSTAALLHKKKIITDKDEFIKQMRKKKQVVRAGCFLFNEQITVAQAMDIVKNEPLLSKEIAEYNQHSERIVVDAACVVHDEGK